MIDSYRFLPYNSGVPRLLWACIDKQKMDSQNTKTTSENEQKSAADHSSAYLKALAVMGITTGYIFGPMILILLPAWWLSQRYHATWIAIVGALIALVISNVLIFRNTDRVLKKLSLKK